MDLQGTLQLWEQTATASLYSTASPLGEILVYLVKAWPSIRAQDQATTMVTMSPYLKQCMLVWLLQLLACLAFSCVFLKTFFSACPRGPSMPGTGSVGV